ncbi:hypothetical protein [uncultured Clostridium sp.]|uniref:hypothetical protein n=1 Tax=uncultured Clostridium sp. TaxID=59620 RepID=UPI0025F00F99|nr:hypothetical protein [uncultured Clostridium sp.]
MDKCNLNSFEDIMKACGYCFDEDGNIDMNNSGFDEDSFIGCKDMTGGFQGIYPQLFVLIGEVIGGIISEKLPINVQNSFGNWLQLIGQVILTYNAQQQYFQGGPGRYFNPQYFNVSNQFCEGTDYVEDGETKNGARRSSSSKKKIRNVDKEIRKLRSQINDLQREIYMLKRKD